MTASGVPVAANAAVAPPFFYSLSSACRTCRGEGVVVGEGSGCGKEKIERVRGRSGCG
ncbi:hypothetical protein SESBI_40905 [Sesbania bispinosa]|nr:hypothetical protein SESBI_40905 [Sesbania bispinosa]